MHDNTCVECVGVQAAWVADRAQNQRFSVSKRFVAAESKTARSMVVIVLSVFYSDDLSLPIKLKKVVFCISQSGQSNLPARLKQK